MLQFTIQTQGVIFHIIILGSHSTVNVLGCVFACMLERLSVCLCAGMLLCLSIIVAVKLFNIKKLCLFLYLDIFLAQNGLYASYFSRDPAFRQCKYLFGSLKGVFFYVRQATLLR